MPMIAAVVAFLLWAPLLAGAATADEIRAQVEALIRQISLIQGQAPDIPNVPSIPIAQTPSTSSLRCPNLTRTLSRGARGSDVLELQQFLIAEGFLAADSATSYFGYVTEGAVQQWQGRWGVVTSGSPNSTGFGVVGARTRAAIAGRCMGGPTTGNCPLYPVPQCGPSERLEKTAADHAGCPGPLVCKAATVSSAQCAPIASCPFGYTRQLSTVQGCSVATCLPPNSNVVGVTIHGPNGGETFRSQSSVPISWSVTGLAASDLQAHKQYQIGYWLVPLDAQGALSLSVGQRMPSGSELLTHTAGVKSLPAPNGGWWLYNSERTTLESRYRLITAIARLDASVCDTFLTQPIEANTASTAQRVAGYTSSTAPAQCNPYRISALDESDSYFTILQPRITGSYQENYANKTVKVSVEVKTPDACVPYRINWRGPASSGESSAVYTPQTNCVSAPHTATYSHTFTYHTQGNYQAQGGADLLYNGSFADSFVVPIHSMN